MVSEAKAFWFCDARLLAAARAGGGSFKKLNPTSSRLSRYPSHTLLPMSFGAVCEHEPRNASNAADKYAPIHLSTTRKIQGTRHAFNNQVSLIKFHSHVIHAEFFLKPSYTHLGCQLLTGNFDISLLQHDFHLPQTQIQITNRNLSKGRLGMVTNLSFACFKESKMNINNEAFNLLAFYFSAICV
jgi:hypothetical protein